MEKSNVKNKKEAKDDKQKDHKIEEQVLKSLEASTDEERLKLLLQKYVENEKNGRRLRLELKTHEKQLETVLREKENLQREHNKRILMSEKLQEVCREQQKLIKSVKNESMQKIREEEERRKESQMKFQSSLNEITNSLTKNTEENMKLRDHNLEMTKKLKFLAENYHTREEQLEKLNEQVQLESQLYQTKLNKFQVEAALEKEIVLKEKQIALEKLVQTQNMLRELTEREQSLKEQLNLYTAKYDDFQSSLQKSNDIFTTYKVELDKMSKNTKKLEKEAFEWKNKWERSNATVIQLATEKQERDEHAARCTRQVEQLQKLLRALQNERAHLYSVLRENNIEAPPTPPLPPEPEPLQMPTASTNAADKQKMETMSKNCAELKQTLLNLQNQMKSLKIKPEELETKEQLMQRQDELLKKRKNRKQKSKNNKIGNANGSATTATTTTTATAAAAETENIETGATTTVIEEGIITETATVEPIAVEIKNEAKSSETPVTTVENASNTSNVRPTLDENIDIFNVENAETQNGAEFIRKVLTEIAEAVNSEGIKETIAKITEVTAEYMENETLPLKVDKNYVAEEVENEDEVVAVNEAEVENENVSEKQEHEEVLEVEISEKMQLKKEEEQQQQKQKTEDNNVTAATTPLPTPIEQQEFSTEIEKQQMPVTTTTTAISISATSNAAVPN